MKKITALIIVGLLLVYSAVPIFAQDESESAALQSEPDTISINEFDSTVKILQKLNIATNIIDNYEKDKLITRGDFALALNSFGKVEKFNGEMLFDDVDSESKLATAVSNLALTSVMVGYEGSFNPDKFITYTDAAVAMLRFLGYAKSADKQGGYPNGYIKVAASIGLGKNVNADANENISYHEMMRLLENFISVNVLEQTVFGSPEEYAQLEDVGILGYNFDVYYEEGIVAGNGQCVIGKKNSLLSLDEVLVNDRIYKCGETLIKEKLGKYTGFWYKEKEGQKAEILCLIYADESENAKTILSSDIEEFKDSIIYYYTNSGRASSISVDFNCDIIYNGAAAEYKESLFDIEDGSISFCDIDLDGSYDAVIITDYQYAIVEMVDPIGKEIFCKYGISPINLKNSEYKIVNTNGDEVEIETLEEWDVLKIKSDENGEFYTINRSRKVQNGNIEEISLNKLGKSTITVNGLEFEASQFLKQLMYPEKDTDPYIDICAAGDYVTLYLDDDNNIIFYKIKKSRSFNLGYVVTTLHEHGIDKNFVVKMYTEEGKFEELTLKEKITYNGAAKETDTDEFYNEFMQCIPGIVQYDIDSTGAVSKINTPITYNPDIKENDFVCIIEEEPMTNLNGWFISDGASNSDINSVQYEFSDEFVYFKVPSEDSGKTNNLKFYNTSYEPADVTLDGTFSLYTFTGTYNIVDIVVEVVGGHGGGSVTSALLRSPFMIVTDINDAVFEDDLYKIAKGKVNGQEASFYFSTDCITQIDVGDIIQYSANEYGEVNLDDAASFVKRAKVNSETKRVEFDYRETFYDNGYHLFSILAPYQIKNGYIFFNKYSETNDVSVIGNPQTVRAYKYNNIPILVYDIDNKELKEGSIADIETYVGNNGKVSDVLVQVTGAALRTVIVFK